MKKKVLVIGILAMLLGLTVIIKPKKEILIDITNENNKLALFVENEEGIYEEATTIPSSGYTLNTSRSGCNNGAKPSWNLSDNTLKISSLEKNSTSCYLYFRKANAIDKIQANSKVNEETPDFSKIADTDEGIYKAQDDDGTSYYYRGAVTNNYVKFANKYWRIIRINGDGTIRLIYDGTETHANGESTTDSITQMNVYFSTLGNTGVPIYHINEYVGFKNTVGVIHGLDTKSNILEQLENWYKNNLLSYADKIDLNTGFCGDREPSTSSSTSNGKGGTGETATYYGAYIRLVSTWNTTQAPTFKCKNSSDLYTVSGTNKGNKSLEYPIGLITADEVVYAGGYYGTANQSYYLYNGQAYWTLSPYNYSNSAKVFRIDNYGSVTENGVHGSDGIRPVINLRSDVELTGTGTMTDPYVVVGGN